MSDEIVHDELLACFFAGWPDVTPCEGQLVRAHLIAKGRIKKAFRNGAWRDGERWINRIPDEALDDPETIAAWRHLTLEEIQADRRCWIPVCGGLTGIGAHHGQLDNPSSKLRLTRAQLTLDVEEFAAEFGFEALLDREYGPRAGEIAA